MQYRNLSIAKPQGPCYPPKIEGTTSGKPAGVARLIRWGCGYAMQALAPCRTAPCECPGGISNRTVLIRSYVSGTAIQKKPYLKRYSFFLSEALSGLRVPTALPHGPL